MRLIPVIAGLSLLAAGTAVLVVRHGAEAGPVTGQASGDTAAPVTVEKPARRWTTVSLEIPPRATFSALMEGAGVPVADASAMYAAAKPVYDLAAVRAGKIIELRYADGQAGQASQLRQLMYPISTEEELFVTREGEGWTAEVKPVEYDVREKTAEGTIESSLYASALAQGVDERAVIALADVFQWTVDFALDVRKGDSWKMIYEERWRAGKYVEPGRILAAKYVNDGKEYRAYLFGKGGKEGYYDEKGNALRKMFLKAPVAFKYITSGFTTGLRYVSAFNTSTGHRAIDYAAKTGTPIRATADGVVVSAGWNGPYGNFVGIRHNSVYTTNYAHQSKIAVRKGQKVSQGQVIGYVGSTGLSTGPHLHYEMVKNGTKVNPLREEFPGTDPVKDEDRAAFEAVVRSWEGRL